MQSVYGRMSRHGPSCSTSGSHRSDLLYKADLWTGGPASETHSRHTRVRFLSRSRSPAAEHMSVPQPRAMDLLPKQRVPLWGAFPRGRAEMEVERKRRQEEGTLGGKVKLACAALSTSPQQRGCDTSRTAGGRRSRLRCPVNFAAAAFSRALVCSRRTLPGRPRGHTGDPNRATKLQIFGPHFGGREADRHRGPHYAVACARRAVFRSGNQGRKCARRADQKTRAALPTPCSRPPSSPPPASLSPPLPPPSLLPPPLPPPSLLPPLSPREPSSLVDGEWPDSRNVASLCHTWQS